MRPALTLLAAALATVACQMSEQTAENVRTSAEYVLTLQSGTVSALRDRRNQGPFETYDHPPEVMLRILEAAMRKAGPEDDAPYVKVYASPRYGEVLAKEFGEAGKGYSDPFRSAALAIVHPVPGEPQKSRVEVHTVHRGPFHRGRVAWARSLPGWIEQAIQDREHVRRIP